MVGKIKKPGRPKSVIIDTSEPVSDITIEIPESLRVQLKSLTKKLNVHPSTLVIAILNIRLRKPLRSLTLSKADRKERYSQFHVMVLTRIKMILK